jgi:NADPH:quinone reductase-like Zn-dependent oxidoreductase
VRVKVRAAGVAFADVLMREGLYPGTPAVPFTPGYDVAGVVDADADGWKAGQGVVALTKTGGYAEYLCVPETSLVAVPPGLDPAATVSLVLNYLTAFQMIHRMARLTAGERVLVHGAGGGVGSFAVQIARALGAEVTGACSAGKIELVRSLGADHVLDRAREDFTRGERRYDLILDCWASRPLLACRRALVPGGSYVVVGGPMGSLVGMLSGALGALFLSLVSGKRFVQFVARPNREDLETLRALLESGRLTPVVERTFRLEDAPEALRHVEQGGARGKVVLTP